MPRKVTKKKSTKKKTYKKVSKPSATKNLSMVTFGLGLPKKCLVTHKYNEIISLTSTIGSFNSFSFSANGMYDPNSSGTGHQPMYYDQFTPIYNHYTVIGSRITARVMQATATGVPMTVGLFLNDDATLTSSQMTTAKEQTKSNFRQIAAADNNVHTLGLKWSAKKTFGGAVLANDNLQGSVTANPTEQSFYTFVAQCTDGISTNSLVLDVYIEYIAVWDELRDIAGS